MKFEVINTIYLYLSFFKFVIKKEIYYNKFSIRLHSDEFNLESYLHD